LNETAKDVAERINDLAVPVGQKRLVELGENESGAYNFYKVRLERGQLFADYEIALADALVRTLGESRSIHEIGGGYGTFSWLMAGMGFDVVCLELDPRRLDGGVALWQAIAAGWPDIAGSVHFINDRWPDPGKCLCGDHQSGRDDNRTPTLGDACSIDTL
jgi:hypothetical protein